MTLLKKELNKYFLPNGLHQLQHLLLSCPGKKAKKRRMAMQHYQETFKRKVCEEYLTFGGHRTALLKKYNIRYLKYATTLNVMLRIPGHTSENRTFTLHQFYHFGRGKGQQPVVRQPELERILEDVNPLTSVKSYSSLCNPFPSV